MKVCSVDLDGILTDYPTCWIAYVNRETGKQFEAKEEAYEKLGKERYDRLKLDYRLSKYKSSLPIRLDGLNLLHSLKREGYSIIIASDRPFQKVHGLFEMTENWLVQHRVPFDKLISKSDLLAEHVDFHFDDEPFFSVCIETLNRAKTIYDTLLSVALQTYRNFEVIIVDNKSADNTVLEIERFLKSKEFLAHRFMHSLFINSQRLPYLTNWNEPLHHAKGKYIALLEGDDQYLPEHLEKAYLTLTKVPDVGLYSVNNETEQQALADTYTIQRANTPSEMIFLRKNPRPYLFDVETYRYCPEVGLALDIMLNGHNTYRSLDKTVVRYPSSHESPLARYLDYFRIMKEYRHTVSGIVYKRALKLNVKRLGQFLVYFLWRNLQVKKIEKRRLKEK